MHKQIILWVLSGLMAVALVVGGIWIAVNFDKIKNGMSGSNIYTAEDLENAYNDGYSKSFTDKDEYISAIANYKDTITIMQDTISQLNTQITNLTNNNNDLQKTITNLQSQKTELQNTVTTLTNTVNGNTSVISTLNTQVLGLQSQVALLNAGNENKAAEIENLNLQIESLQTSVSILQSTNSTNLTTIISLNEQVTTLNGSISALTAQANQNSNTISLLNNQIAALENSIAYYEQLLMNYETTEKATVTFMFDGSVYNMQVVNKNSTVTVSIPVSTEYIIFNGWSIDGVTPVNLESYTITQNTIFIAMLTYNYKAAFIVDNVTVESFIVEKNIIIAPPAEPMKTNYVFLGWSVDGTIVDVADYPIIRHTYFIAVWGQYETIFSGTQNFDTGANDVRLDKTYDLSKVYSGGFENAVFRITFSGNIEYERTQPPYANYGYTPTTDVVIISANAKPVEFCDPAKTWLGGLYYASITGTTLYITNAWEDNGYWLIDGFYKIAKIEILQLV